MDRHLFENIFENLNPATEVFRKSENIKKKPGFKNLQIFLKNQVA